MSSVTSEEEPDGEGLRERRRRRTERDINEAALDLFESHGFDGTTVDDIAHAAGVSPRTFFRYFPTKESAALLTDHVVDDLVLVHLDGLHGDQPLVPQLEAMWESVFTALTEDATRIRQLLRVRRLVHASPAVRAAASQIDEQRLADLVTRLTAVTSSDELEVRVVAEVVAGPVRVAFDVWAEAAEDGRDLDLAELYGRCRGLAHR